jgi:two-component system alkaline phosphatase synthesis response regulator PhoP
VKKKILIVEDEENVIELLKINLLRRGYQVETAGSGESAIEIAKQGSRI